MTSSHNLILSSLIGLLLVLASCTRDSDRADNTPLLFNSDWQFILGSDTTEVNLPHTPRIEPLVITTQQWQGTCYYRKTFNNPEPGVRKYIALRFKGAMHHARVFLNSELISTHTGGYLPFIVDLSGKLKDGENTILLELNNEDNKHIPPGKAMAGLDFNYYGGLYRDVELIVKEEIYISDAVDANIKGGGGVKIIQKELSQELAKLAVNVDIVNLNSKAEEIRLEYQVYDPDERVVTSYSTGNTSIDPAANTSIQQDMEIINPLFWSTESPSLYTIEISLYRDDRLIEKKKLRTGLREIEFDSKGFYINGEMLKIRGTNRHQEYPYLGYAIGGNADYRDAFKIKEAGFNFVRLSHYPHSEDFLDACDELGILVMDAIPGWQFVGDSIFREHAKKDLRDMIRRDRNHPSIILWEASLNESWMPWEFISEMHQITKEELEGRDSYTCGWMDTIYDVFIPARQHASPPDYWNSYTKDKALLIAEYGDWEYYAQNAGFNQTDYKGLMEDERTSRQLRAYGQKRLLQQALNYQEAHNDNLRGSHAGDANWLMFDYNRGYAPDIESSGIMDIFRIPKFSYWFYRSQKDLVSGDTVLFIANYWNESDFTDVKVFSNCSHVEIWLNDSLIARQKPDTDRYSENLSHPPFTFVNQEFAAGRLEARGIVNGEYVKTVIRKSPEAASRLELAIDYSERKLARDKADVVFVYASIVDTEGTPVYSSDSEVFFSLEGEGELIGDNPVKAEAGIATILYRTYKHKGSVSIYAESAGLKKDIKEIEFK